MRGIAKPPPVEFLPDEFVNEDVEAYEAVPDEFVIEDESNVVFAGPSDAPPRPDSPTAAAIGARRHRVSGSDARRRRLVGRVALSVSLGAAALVATVRLIGSSPPRSSSNAAASSPVAPPSYELAANTIAQSRASANVTPTDVPTSSANPVASSDVPSAEADAAGAGEYSEAVDTKQASQQALELGKVALATSLGERSVALDPTDATSWLILGAAYMQSGDNKNARRCFSSCVKQATTGARRECAAMLR